MPGNSMMRQKLTGADLGQPNISSGGRESTRKSGRRPSKERMYVDSSVEYHSEPGTIHKKMHRERGSVNPDRSRKKGRK